MKKISLLLLLVSFAIGSGYAGELASQMTEKDNTTLYASVNFPTGVFFNGSNFVKVERSWVRICIGGESSEYDIRNSELDPWGNYALVLSNGASITIYSNGKSLSYNGTTYSKK